MPIKFLLLGGGGGFWVYLEGGGGGANFIFMGVGIFLILEGFLEGSLAASAS